MTKRLPRATKWPSFYWYWPNTCVRLSNVLDDSGLMVQRACDFTIICFLARLQIMGRGIRSFLLEIGKLIWNCQIAWKTTLLSFPKRMGERPLSFLRSDKRWGFDQFQDGHWTRLASPNILKGDTDLVRFAILERKIVYPFPFVFQHFADEVLLQGRKTLLADLIANILLLCIAVPSVLFSSSAPLQNM